ncbi:MAG: nickel pincer cofactor biosynthesis protein LarB [Proteobacteria bacterium]|nr:nickel pincer cofactor biosynthesis protein LarB [Pseudomonadota bacterium]MBU1547162.1 nickel pincer cofactor biosynthesis protein LarB [Pseudomonadota bacterium]MBU2620192.1 nickel pincer cofactor biosynthesis protein LarB [Pseudomonadota bacterium]
MDEKRMQTLLQEVSRGACTVADALAELKHFPSEMLSCAHLDHHRRLRTGVPEVVYGENKTACQIADILKKLLVFSPAVMATRVSPEKGEAVCLEIPGLVYHGDARMVTAKMAESGTETHGGEGLIVVLTAGTSDIPVAEEAYVTLRCLGHAVEKLYDVGVAGIHRLLSRRDLLDKACVLIVVAGMEGALPSVVGGLVDKPIIAVPTSVGYGTGLGGIAALLGMLNSCAPGIAVVNIDNGFGAACMAASIGRQIRRQKGRS